MDMNRYTAYAEHIKSRCDFSGNKSTSDIASLFHSVIQGEIGADIKQYATWDYELFLCCEIEAKGRENDQSFIFPQWVGADGACIPDVEGFEEERLEFYKQRLNDSNEPVLRFRYCNYLLERLPQGRERYDLSKLLCEELMDHISRPTPSFDFCNKLSRLLEISLMYKITDVLSKVNAVTNSAINELAFVDETSTEHGIVLLCLSQTIRFFRNKLSQFTSETTVDFLISEIYKYRDYYINNDIRLAVPFQRELLEWAQIKQTDVKIVAKEMGKIYEQQACKADSKLAAISFFEMAMQTYLNYGVSEEIDRVKVAIKDTTRKFSNSDELKEHFIPLDESFVEKQQSLAQFYIQTYFDGELSESIEKLTLPLFIPDNKKVEADSKKSAQSALFTQFVSINAISNGRSTFIGNDLNDHELFFFAQHYSHALLIYFSVFNIVWDKLQSDGMTAEAFAPLFKDKEYLAEDQKQMIACGITRFFDDDYISALHILVPQFENAFRRFFESYGYATTSVSSDTTQKEQTFTTFLENDFVKCLPESYLYMIDFVMVNNIGYNLRNDIAHGLIELKTINKSVCQMVIYMLLILAGMELGECDETGD